MLDLHPKTTRPLQILEVRPLAESDEFRLAQRAPVKPIPLKKMRNRHHALARCLAHGMPAHEASLATGYDQSVISILQNDELFKELLAFYRSQAVDTFQATEEQLQGLTTEAISELRDRIENAPEGISTRDLIEVSKLGADRTGHGVQSTQVSIDLNLTDRMKAARQRLSAVSASPPPLEGKATELVE